MSLFSFGNDNLFLGVDIGDSSLKMVELKKKNRKMLLSNYAFSENVSEVNFTKIEDVNYLAKAISKVRSDAGIKAKKVTASLPTFAVFSSIINLSNVDRKNIALAINEEARKVVPLPLEDMILDWKIIPDETGNIPTKGNMRVFLTGSPKKLVRKYIDVFKQAKLDLVSLETETFSLVRSLIGDDKSTVMIVEIGANSTDIFVVKESIPVLNRSLVVCASTVTKVLAEKLGMTYAQAEQFKFDLSVTLGGDDAEELPKLIAKTLEPIVTEIQYVLDFFHSHHEGEVEKIVLSGGGAMLLNLAEYFSKRLNKKVIIGDSWNRVSYPEELKPVLSEVGAKLAVAVGLAMREMES
ncbi:type IV pilus assembly protein PilM [Candidatus Falkowbacteria bacterium]|mgnify:CR=1 FL=1|jgi:type IV pilus assembly protein PilM|nr:type IV pilus assembly protein PilM [Candidatus Falkowbacteria bacterium]